MTRPRRTVVIGTLVVLATIVSTTAVVRIRESLRYREIILPLEKLTANVEQLAIDVDGWTGKSLDVDAELLHHNNLTAMRSFEYRHTESGQVVLVQVICGTARHVTIHTNIDFSYAPYKLETNPESLTVRHEYVASFLSTVNLIAYEEGCDDLRLTSGYSSDGGWLDGRPYAKVRFAGYPALAKVYFIEEPRSIDPADSSPTVKFAGDYLPKLTKSLFLDQVAP